MGDVAKRTEIHQHAGLTFVTHDEMCAKKMAGIVLQIDGELARRGFILKQAKPHIGQPRLVAGNDILVGGGEDLRAHLLAGHGDADDTVTAGEQRVLGRLAEEVGAGRVLPADVAGRARQINAACRLISNTIDTAPERVVDILDLGRDKRGVFLDIIGAGQCRSGPEGGCQ